MNLRVFYLYKTVGFGWLRKASNNVRILQTKSTYVLSE